MLITLLFQSPVLFLIVALALVISISIHEFSHAFVATKLGDPTPRMLGRVTLNPKAHLDPLGTILLLTVGFGWGKPVPFNPSYLKNPKKGIALVSLAGPLANIFVAVLAAGLAHILGGGVGLYFVVFYNLVLGFFNLLPFHPLDGFKVIGGFLPEHLYAQWLQIAPYGVYILLFLILTRSIGVLLKPLLDIAMSILGMDRF